MRLSIFKILGAMFLVCGLASAQPFNPNFNGVNWQEIDPLNVFVTTNAGTGSATTPAGGGVGGSPFAAMETTLGLPAGSINTASTNASHLGIGPAFSGTAFYQDFSLQPVADGGGAIVTGDILSIDNAVWDLDNFNNDFAFAFLLEDGVLLAPTTTGAVTTANAGVAQFIEFNSPTVAGSGGTWTLTAGSTYSLGFVNVNTDNDDNSSNLNVSLLSYAAMAGPGPGPGGVPEIDAGTATFPLAVVGLIFLVIGDGRRRKAMAKL